MKGRHSHICLIACSGTLVYTVALVPAAGALETGDARELIGSWQSYDGNAVIEFAPNGRFIETNRRVGMEFEGKYAIQGNMVRIATKTDDHRCSFTFSSDRFLGSRHLNLAGCKLGRGGAWSRPLERH